ncbi:MAG: hypothetical protein QGF74_01955 [Candidatus Nanoarchaeia archaeon]|jgi:hypothetical protein|nr:hypothetical protein [Candidatus Nanoarchaeia archaeon]|tara:strand:- start:38717 stop:38962 length:246 start_codon:yes stop_codon:yes gene_type:complete
MILLISTCKDKLSVENIGDKKVDLFMKVIFKSDSKSRYNESKNLATLNPSISKIVSFTHKEDELLDINDCSLEKNSVKFVR